MLKEEQFRDEAGLMLLCAGVPQPVTRGKGTKRDQTPCPAQHSELGTGTEMFMVPAQGNQSSSFTADVGQEHGECPASAPCSQHTSPATPCVSHNRNSLWNREGGTLVAEGSLCPCTEPAEMMTMAAQPQARGSGRAFPQVAVKNSFFPR